MALEIGEVITAADANAVEFPFLNEVFFRTSGQVATIPYEKIINMSPNEKITLNWYDIDYNGSSSLNVYFKKTNDTGWTQLTTPTDGAVIEYENIGDGFAELKIEGEYNWVLFGAYYKVAANLTRSNTALAGEYIKVLNSDRTAYVAEEARYFHGLFARLGYGNA